MIKKMEKSDKEWKQILTPQQYRVMRKRGTERAFSGKYNDHHEKGIYVCAGCGTPLFRSEVKYDHGTGWPSFTAPVDEQFVELFDDYSRFMHRIEIRCAVCGAHLGHLFSDGPPPSHNHYCINSVSLDFQADESEEAVSAALRIPEKSSGVHEGVLKTETAVVAAGCFWGVEYNFSQVPGVLSTEVGYVGGDFENPTYRQVCTGKTGHAEAVKVTFNPEKISYEQLLDVFFRIHDPTQLNRQGPDVGKQYRSAIFYLTDEQKQAAERKLKDLQDSARYRNKIVTEITPAADFYRAEEYHQKYYEKRKKGLKGTDDPDDCAL